MTLSLRVCDSSRYAIPPKALRRWASERVRQKSRPDGGTICTFALSGSTCNNRAINVVMTLNIDANGRIESATARPATDDTGCDTMCAAQCDGGRFLAEVGGCDDIIGLTLHEAAFRDWQEEPSGCFCTAGNRRHKWRNVLQALHYARNYPESRAGE